MKATTPWKTILVLGLLVLSNSVLAVTPAEDEGKKKCTKPKFRDFVPAAKAEVGPGTEISFHTSHNAEPLTIGAEAKGQKLKVNVRDRKTFYEVKAQLPAEMKNTFARISVHAKSAEGEGECEGHDGWLIKINGDGATETPDAAKPASAQ